MKKSLLVLALIMGHISFAQETASTDSTSTSTAPADSSEAKPPSKFDAFNKKAEHLFKIIPVPLYSYSTDAGHIVGLAKYNLFDLSHLDTISQPSKISELVTFSSEGRIKIAVSTDLIWKENKYMHFGRIVFKKQAEYLLGIGNDVKLTDAEEFVSSQFEFVNTFYMRTVDQLYVGIGFDITDYTNMEFDTLGQFYENPDINGTGPGTNMGLTLGSFLDKRENRYNPNQGYYIGAKYVMFPDWAKNEYQYGKFDIDLRKYFNPWYDHVLAFQTTTTYCHGDVPFYDLAFLGGDSQMRGYYFGALRDNVLVDGQVEYRMPVWSIIGVTGWLGTGRVAHSYSDLALDGFWLNYGFGLRLKVDSKNNTNLRFDMGFGNDGISGFYINFAEAF